VKFYLSMRPAAAAKVLAQQEDLLVIELFRRMPERNVAAILAEMDPTVSGAIMRKMSR
jgi:flagellar motility protein MotE (MotC chaperone)